MHKRQRRDPKEQKQLYVFRRVLCDYTAGLAVSLADSKEAAIGILIEEFKRNARVSSHHHAQRTWYYNELKKRENELKMMARGKSKGGQPRFTPFHSGYPDSVVNDIHDLLGDAELTEAEKERVEVIRADVIRLHDREKKETAIYESKITSDLGTARFVDAKTFEEDLRMGEPIVVSTTQDYAIYQGGGS